MPVKIPLPRREDDEPATSVILPVCRIARCQSQGAPQLLGRESLVDQLHSLCQIFMNFESVSKLNLLL